MYPRLGGASNVAVNIAEIGGKCFLVSICGNDTMRFELQDLLQQIGINSYLYEDSSRPTISKTRILSGQHHLLRIDDENINNLSPDAEKEILSKFSEILPDCQVAIISDYGKGICTPSVCQSAINMCRERKIPVFVDPKGTN